MDTKSKGTPLLLLALVTVLHAQQIGPTGNTCPDKCADSIRPVCGTNNIVYRNACVLQQTTCVNSNIKKKNDGPCVSSSSQKRDCNRRCNSSFQPVCATNGKTYDNRCKLSRVTCENANIKERYEGVCPVSPNGAPTEENSGSPSTVGNIAVRPSRPTAVGGLAIGAPVLPILQQSSRPPTNTPASVINTPRPVRNCRDNCNPGFRPVCGSDGQVYGNVCKLRVAICKNPNLRKKNDGVCEKDCSIQCPVEINYVCGSDGKTYVNDCELTVARCKDPAIKKASNGQCPVIREVECDIQSCDRTTNPVCGSDGRTYRNQCLLFRQACFDQSLLKLHNGECAVQKCGDVCPSALEPVCGTDGKSYPNHCTLINSACRARSGIVKFADGLCPRNNG